MRDAGVAGPGPPADKPRPEEARLGIMGVLVTGFGGGAMTVSESD